MELNKINGELFKAMVIGGAENLKKHYAEIDKLNVFPVPDGDTGTNMRMTIEGGVNEIYNLHEQSIQVISKKFSRGMLMGARGNSGVILSQLFRGLSKGFDGFEQVDAIRLAQAFKSGVEQAYKAVMKPTEGTILTVSREATERLCSISSSRMSINEFFDEYVNEAKASLERTPDLLPVLKEAGVVDSGGAGFICIIEGMIDVLNGAEVDICDCGLEHSHFSGEHPHHHEEAKVDDKIFCVEFSLKLDDKFDYESFDGDRLSNALKDIAKEVVIIKEDELVKGHLHSYRPGEVLTASQNFGDFKNIKIEKLIDQMKNTEIKHVEEGVCECGEEHHHKVEKPKERKKYAIVTVASGEGLMKTFTELGADYIVSGGQSMNPSTEDFIKGYDTLNAEHIFVLPNNKNIILAADQSAKIYEEANIHVIHTTTIAQGFSALTMIDLTGSVDDVIKSVVDTIANVTTGLITYSIRDTKVNGVDIKKDDHIGICNGNIVCANRRKSEAVRSLLKSAIDDNKSVITIIYGNDTSDKEVNEVVKYIEKNYSDLETVVIEGNQEVYSYILAIE